MNPWKTKSKSTVYENDDDAEDETVEWGFDDVGYVFPCFGHGERLAHATFFG